MPSKPVVVASTSGLHARPAKIFTLAAKEAGLPVTVSFNGRTVNAASILSIMSLGVDKGHEVIVGIDDDEGDPDQVQAALDRLVSLLELDLDTV